MSETLVVPELKTGASVSMRKYLAGVFLMSFASLLLELGLTRLFSVILFYHFAFLAISIALLGLGAGGVVAYLSKSAFARWTAEQIGFAACVINAGLMLLVVEIDLHVPVFLLLTLKNFFRLSTIYLVSALPFFFTGFFFSVLFARRTAHISQLYAADLVGGAAACLAIVPLLNVMGGPNAVLFAGLAMAVAAVIWANGKPERLAAMILAVVLMALLAANYRGGLLDIVYAKGMYRDPKWVEFAKWNAISRVEVDNQGGARVIVIDADAATAIMGTDPKNWGPEWRRHLMSAAPSVANILRPRGEYAIIGPGGGVDVLRAVANGSPAVTGIEINPIIVNSIMRRRYADYSYHLYDRPEVHIHVSDGRSWVRQSDQKFDVLQMTLVDTWASTAAGAFALSENNLYTVEAFREYFDHLKPDGMLAITRWEFKHPREALRVVSQAMRALAGQDAGPPTAAKSDLRRNFIVVSDGALNEDGRAVAVLAKKTPFTADEELAVTRHLAENPNLVPLYLPSYAEGGGPLPPGAAPFRDLIWSGNPEGFAQQYVYNVAPVYDNAPFFFFTVKPSQLWHHSQSKAGIDWKVNMGVVVLAMLVCISAAAVLLFLILPLLLLGRRRPRHAIWPLAYFVAVGLGYIAVEITLIQRLVLFLGHPIYALTVVVFLMLLSSGVGSWLSRRWLHDPLRVRMVIGLVVLVLAAYVWLLPVALYRLIGLPFAAKLIVCGVLVIPVGFAMGMPFPSGLRALAAGDSSDNLIEWAWAMNAASSVLGSVLAMAIAVQYGLGVTLACATAAYLVSAGLVSRLKPLQP